MWRVHAPCPGAEDFEVMRNFVLSSAHTLCGKLQGYSPAMKAAGQVGGWKVFVCAITWKVFVCAIIWKVYVCAIT